MNWILSFMLVMPGILPAAEPQPAALERAYKDEQNAVRRAQRALKKAAGGESEAEAKVRLEAAKKRRTESRLRLRAALSGDKGSRDSARQEEFKRAMKKQRAEMAGARAELRKAKSAGDDFGVESAQARLAASKETLSKTRREYRRWLSGSRQE